MRCWLPVTLLALGACTTQTMERDAMGIFQSDDAPAAERKREQSRAPDAVSRQDREDGERGVLSITLERVAGVAVTRDSVPTVRFGDGMRIVGVDRIVLRFWAQQSAERPIWFHAAGAGKSAFFKVEVAPPQEWRGRSVDVRSEIHNVAGAYRFDWSAEAKP